jgi:hypothetical protein
MKTMWIAFAAMALVTVGAWYGLNEAGFSAADQTSGDAVRLD